MPPGTYDFPVLSPDGPADDHRIMRIAVLHNDVPDTAPPDEKDALLQAEAVRSALLTLGHETVLIPFPMDIREVVERFSRQRPDGVFNLVESVGGQGRFIHLAPAVLDALSTPYTGSPTSAVFLTSHKLETKKCLRSAGLPTPPWHSTGDTSADTPVSGVPFIIKSVWEHASIGLGDDSIIVPADAGELQVELEKRKEQLGGEAFAERYIDGREFNLSLLERKEGVSVLPPAEILFRDFPADKPRIVGYRAKWDEGAHEYHNTPRSFDFPAGDRELLERLKTLSRSCWDLFGLRGYARVDFRVDRKGVPWILEINTNPCLTPDSGFVAAAAENGLDYADLIAEIVAGAFRR